MSSALWVLTTLESFQGHVSDMSLPGVRRGPRGPRGPVLSRSGPQGSGPHSISPDSHKGPPSGALALCASRCSALHRWGRVAGPGSVSGPQGSGKASTGVRMSPQTLQVLVRACAGRPCTGSSPFWSSKYSTSSPRCNILSPKLYILAVSIYIIYTRDGEIQRTPAATLLVEVARLSCSDILSQSDVGVERLGG